MKSFTKTTTETFTPRWVCQEFTKYSESFINIRNHSQYKANKCFKCDHKFELNESIGLAAFQEVGNKVLCKPCAEELSK